MRRALVPIVFLACLLALICACYGSVIFFDRQFAYRDAAHFYYPLYLRVQQEWDAGRWPLWEPEENGGMPLLGNPTAAVLYPGKICYASKLFSYAWGTRLYVVLHTMLACAGMLVMLRSWGVGWAGSALAALSYAFGAPILFQYCNIIFLVGAAWLPWGLRAVDRWLRLDRRWALLELAVVLAMQTLGGDPQSAYLTGICAAGYAVGLRWKTHDTTQRRLPLMGLRTVSIAIAWVAATLAVAHLFSAAGAHRQTTIKPVGIALRQLPWVLWVTIGLVLVSRWRRGRSGAELGKKMAGLAAAALLACGLSAAQLLPVLEFTKLSLRAAAEGPHTIYPFSLEPHRALEMLWPSFFGTSFGTNRMWLAMVPPMHTPSTWVPSLYLGGLALMLCLGAAGFRHGPPWRAWLTAIAILSFLASLGEYGSPIWWGRSMPAFRWFGQSIPAGQSLLGPQDPPPGHPMRTDGGLPDGTGSFYWFLATVLPGFGAFRYPSKLLSLTSLALAALAGIGWDRMLAGKSKRVIVLSSVLLALSLSALTCTAGARGRIVAALAAHPAAQGGSIFGPFDAAGAVVDLQRSLAHGAVVLSLALTLIFSAARRPRLASTLALVVVAADLALANARIVMTLPQADLEKKPRVLKVIEDAEKADPSPGPFRVHRMPLWNPPGWYKTRSQKRIREMVLWERDTLQPKYALPFHLNYTLTEGVTELYDYWWFFGAFYRTLDARTAQFLNAQPGEKVVYYPRRGFDLWTTRYFILPVFANGWKDDMRGYASFLTDSEPVTPKASDFKDSEGSKRWLNWIAQEDWQVLRNKDVYPRAWVVHNARRLPPIAGLNKEDRRAPMEEILFQNDPFWTDSYRVVHDPRALAWIETDDLNQIAQYLPKTPPDPAETVTITKYESQRVEVTAVLKRPGIVILADVYYPGWHLTIDGQPAPILRANRLMRGAAVESGTHHLVFTYDPDSFRIGGVISIASLIVLVGLGLWVRHHPRAQGWIAPKG